MQDDIKTTLPVGTTGVPATDVFRAIAATCRPRTFEVSITAWDQLSWPAACDSASWGWCGRSQTPAACQPRSRSFPSRGPNPAPAPCRWLGRTDAGAASARRDRSCVSTVSIPYAGRSATCRPLEDFVQPDRADVARRTAREDLLQTVAMGRGRGHPRRAAVHAQVGGVTGDRTPSHCSASQAWNRSTSVNPSFAARRIERSLAVWVESTTGSPGSDAVEPVECRRARLGGVPESPRLAAGTGSRDRPSPRQPDGRAPLLSVEQ